MKNNLNDVQKFLEKQDCNAPLEKRINTVPISKNPKSISNKQDIYSSIPVRNEKMEFKKESNHIIEEEIKPKKFMLKANRLKFNSSYNNNKIIPDSNQNNQIYKSPNKECKGSPFGLKKKTSHHSIAVTNVLDLSDLEPEFCEKEERKIPFNKFLEQNGINMFEEKDSINYEMADSKFWTSNKFEWEDELKKKNWEVFKHKNFRMHQVNIINLFFY